MSDFNPWASLMDQSDLPNIPGFRVDFDSRSEFPKAHWFDFKNGIPMGDLRVDSKASNKAAAKAFAQAIEQEKAAVISSVKVPTKSTSRADGAVPSWVVEQRTLSWLGYFIENIQNSAIEKERIHKLKIIYHLVDDTIEMIDLKSSPTDDSGIVLGKFLKRHRVPKDASECTFLTPVDFVIGSKVSVYGREVSVCQCNEFARSYLQSRFGIVQLPNQDFPKDDFVKHGEQNEYYKSQSGTAGESDIRAYVEALLGRQSHKQLVKQRQYLELDGQVLRFWAQWTDPSVDPSIGNPNHAYVIHYFLSDDTVEVRNCADRGRQSFPLLLTRRRLPKVYNPRGVEFGKDDNNEYYRFDDLAVGHDLNVFGRQVRLTSADGFTKKWYIEHCKRTEEDFTPVFTETPVKKEEPKHTKKSSTTTTKSKRAIVGVDSIALRFLAKLENADECRRFIIEFYVDDGAIQIYEKPVRNSGFLGGKFLERTLSELKPSDFKLNEIVTVLGSWKFIILAADPRTAEYSYATASEILNALAEKLYDRNESQHTTFLQIDTDRDRHIDERELRAIAMVYGWKLNDKQLKCVFEYFDADKSGGIRADEFLAALNRVNVKHTLK
jgi:hypothetical protein